MLACSYAESFGVPERPQEPPGTQTSNYALATISSWSVSLARTKKKATQAGDPGVRKEPDTLFLWWLWTVDLTTTERAFQYYQYVCFEHFLKLESVPE
mmetsp:Transcript_75345/g.133198  ORF Transcript_75345/g.133198 Transcript_75345/m.133198 type:complete len:98 (-) Transcript_75345:13-306(-)